MSPREVLAIVLRWCRRRAAESFGDRDKASGRAVNGSGPTTIDLGMRRNQVRQTGRMEVGQNEVREMRQDGRIEEPNNKIDQVRPDGPSGRDGERDPYGEVTIVVMANEKADKANLVKAIKQGDPSNWKVEPPVGRVRFHSRQHPFRKIIEPTPLDFIRNRSPSALGRRWISENSLRRIIVKKFVIGVCVITPKILTANCSSSVFHYDSCWVDVLHIIFGEQRNGIFFVVKDDESLDASDRKKFESFIRQHDFDPNNLIYSGFGDEVRNVLEQNIAMVAGGPRMGNPSFRITPFYLREQLNPGKTRKIWNSERYSVWTPERVILFGRTGNGKSTLAQMLTTGKLDPDAKNFSYSSSIRGHSRDIEDGEGRGWYVVDSPGFGEPASGGTLSSDEVQRMLKKFIDLINGTYAHYLFVTREGRVDELEAVLWRFFRDLFGEELCSQFSIIVSDADGQWIQNNIDHLRASFVGCTSFIPADFPTVKEEDKREFGEDLVRESPNFLEELQKENEEVQRSSLQHLESELAKLARPDRACDYGKGSKISKAIERDRADSDMKVEKSLMRRMINEAPQLLFGLDEIVSSLVHRLTVNDRIKLVPLVI